MPNWCQNQLTLTNVTPRLRRWLDTHGFTFKKMNPPKKPRKSDPNGWQHSDCRIVAWGTKWDLDDTQQAEVADELLREECAFFDTAWSPPLEAITALSRKFPEVVFTLHYCELGMFFAGIATIQAGECEDTMHEDHSGVITIACDVFGYDDEEDVQNSKSQPADSHLCVAEDWNDSYSC